MLSVRNDLSPQLREWLKLRMYYLVAYELQGAQISTNLDFGPVKEEVLGLPYMHYPDAVSGITPGQIYESFKKKRDQSPGF